MPDKIDQIIEAVLEHTSIEGTEDQNAELSLNDTKKLREELEDILKGD